MRGHTDTTEQREKRVELLEIIEDAIRPEHVWRDRDSEQAHRQLGEAWALLRAGCDFRVHSFDEDYNSSESTTIITVWSWGFDAFEYGEEGIKEDTFYIPTRKRLNDRGPDKDWY